MNKKMLGILMCVLLQIACMDSQVRGVFTDIKSGRNIKISFDKMLVESDGNFETGLRGWKRKDISKVVKEKLDVEGFKVAQCLTLMKFISYFEEGIRYSDTFFVKIFLSSASQNFAEIQPNVRLCAFLIEPNVEPFAILFSDSVSLQKQNSDKEKTTKVLVIFSQNLVGTFSTIQFQLGNKVASDLLFSFYIHQ